MHRFNSIRPSGSGTHITLLLCLLLAGLAHPARAQDTVSIPKSRLEELEKKEAELEKLRNQVSPQQPAPASQAPVKASVPGQAPAIASAPVSAPVPPSPALSTLPELKQDEVVSAIDLANHFQQDRAAAERRYKKRSFAVQGEIERFEKNAFSRSYRLIMKTANSNLKVICEVYPPGQYTAVFTANDGSEMVGVFGENRKIFARAGSVAVTHGECKGLEGPAVVLKSCALKSILPVGK